MSQTTERIHELVEKLNRYRHEYYNEDAPSVSDAVYDHLYDELARAEKETGIILSNSPTQTVGYKAVSSLEKVRHRIPLLSLDKTKLVSDLVSFVKEHAALLMLKLDGLTVKLVYEDGKLLQGSTRATAMKGNSLPTISVLSGMCRCLSLIRGTSNYQARASSIRATLNA